MVNNKKVLNELKVLMDELRNINNKIDTLTDKQRELENKLKKFDYVNPEYNKLKQSNKKNVLLCGFYGGYNLGDELMLETLLTYLKDFKNISFTIMLANNDKYDISNYPEVDFIHYPQTEFDLNYLVEYFDSVIFGGGALICDNDYDSKYINELPLSRTLIQLTKRMICNNKKCLWLGLSSSKELNNISFIKELDFIVKNNKDIYFRDQYSIDVISKLGINVANIKLIDDIIFANKYLKDKKPNKNNDKKQIGVILVCNHELYDKNISIIKMLNEFFKMNYSDCIINLIPFYDYNKNDYTILNRYKDEIKEENIKVLEYNNSMESIVKVINNQDYIVSMRYHGALLSMMLKKPLLTILFDTHAHYDNKIKYIVDKYSYSKNVIAYSEIDQANFFDCLEKLCKERKFKDLYDYMEKSQKDIKEILNRFIKE